MKGVITLFLLCFFWSFTYSKPQGTYTTKYDGIDVDGILNNRRLLLTYMKCLLDQGKCTKEGAELKKSLPDALATECSKCSDRQKTLGRKVLKHIYEKEQDYFQKIEAKYDPQGVFRARYRDAAKREGYNI